MARAKRDNPLGGLLFLALWVGIPLILLFFSYLGFLILLILWWRFEQNACKYPKITKAADFATSEDYETVRSLLNKKKKIETRLTNIEAQAENAELLRRKDGAFDERSPLARKLNAQENEARGELEHAFLEYYEKKSEVMDRYQSWRSTLCGQFAFRMTILFYLITALITYLIYPNFFQKLPELLWYGRPSWLPPSFFGVTILASVASLCFVVVAWWIKSELLKATLPDLGGFLKDWTHTEDDKEAREVIRQES